MRDTMKMAISLDDILLEPQYSEIDSRLDTSVKTRLTTKKKLEIPIMATNMSTITEYDMMKTMSDLGGVACLHRFLPNSERLDIVRKAYKTGVKPIMASIGVGDKEYSMGVELIQAGADILLIDVAHAHSKGVFDQLNNFQVFRKNIDIIVGNIATKEAAAQFLAVGVDGLRIGIGPGSRCLTRTVTGHGVPNATALLGVRAARTEYAKNTGAYVPLIMDGGLRTSGDIVKALYIGADVACLGGMLAGTEETPGQIVKNGGGLHKKFYGMASKDAMEIHGKGKPGIAAEGFSELVPYQGSVRPIVEEIVGGIRSGLSYTGAKTIAELRQKGRPMLLSQAAQYESKIR